MNEDDVRKKARMSVVSLDRRERIATATMTGPIVGKAYTEHDFERHLDTCTSLIRAPSRERPVNRILYDLPFAEYLTLDGWNYSSLKVAAKSLKHYRHALTAPRKDTAAFLLGRAVDELVFTPPGQSCASLAVYPGARRAGKEWDAFEAANAGRIIVKENELATATAMRDAVWADPDARYLLNNGKSQVTLQWTHAPTGALLRSRLDWLDSVELPVIVELKTTRHIEPDAYERDAENLLYRAQTGMYAAGVEALTGTWPEVYSIVVENVAPHDVVVYRVPDEILVDGWRTAEGWVRAVAEATRTGHWPGVNGGAGVREMKRAPWGMVGAEVDMSGIEGEV